MSDLNQTAEQLEKTIQIAKKQGYEVKAVFKGLIMETEEHALQLHDGFKELGFHAPVVLGTFKTTSGGVEGEGGRSEVVMLFHNDDVMRLAVHPMHLSGGFSWHDDYLNNNRAIIPAEGFALLE